MIALFLLDSKMRLKLKTSFYCRLRLFYKIVSQNHLDEQTLDVYQKLQKIG
jgi:hypothetical protein